MSMNREESKETILVWYGTWNVFGNNLGVEGKRAGCQWYDKVFV